MIKPTLRLATAMKLLLLLFSVSTLNSADPETEKLIFQHLCLG